MEEFTKKYYKISEVCEIVGEPASTLRYWETVFPQLKVKRNDRGTRFYTPANIDTIRRIQYLVNDRGLHIDAAAEQMRTAPDSVAAKQKAIERLTAIRARLVAFRDALHALR